MGVFAAIPRLDPWRFQAHPEVWLLVGSLVAAFVYCVRVIGPRAVAQGIVAADAVMTRKQLWCFVGAMALLWVGSDWPIHDLGEEYLYSAHMVQHMMFTYLMPPLALLATPEWLLRTLLGRGRAYRVFRLVTRPLLAGLVFNAMIVVSHIPGVVNESVSVGALHYLMHLLLVTSALGMWMSVCGPLPELRMQPAPKMVYLFLMSVVPTIPAAWLTFAEGTVYRPYGEQPVRVWGLSVTADQQLAGAIMKTGGSIFLWTIIVWIWFRRFSANHRVEHDYRRSSPTLPAGSLADVPAGTLEYEDVERVFAATAPRDEPEH